MQWSILSFSELNTTDLYTILQLRAEVFVVEQNCAYQDLDSADSQALHVLGYKNNALVAYSRILPTAITQSKYVAIGRVVVNTRFRGQGLGYELMEKSIAFCRKEFKNTAIKISAQSHLKTFYGSLGFVYKNEDYLEDGIPHCAMYLE